jgi:hypothetical protein
MVLKGKPWTVEEENELRQLVEARTPVEVIAGKLQRRREAVAMKCRRLGLEVVVTRGYSTTTSLAVPKELPSVEEALGILAGALRQSRKAGLDKVEVQRLQAIATLARTYKELLADYLDYRGIEVRITEMEAKYAKLAESKAKVDSSTPAAAEVA